MSDQHGSLNEPKSYDADLRADVLGAVEEVSKAPDEPELPLAAEKPAAEEPRAEAPVETRGDHPTDPKRYADGTFKPTKEETAADAKSATEIKPVVEVKPGGLTVQQAVDQVAQVTGNPPPGWSVKSKSEWDKLPEHIRADIVKREQEVDSGFAQYSGMKELLPYVERAKSQGQTLRQVLDNFIGYEDFVRRSPLQGILYIANNVGMTPQKLAMELAPYLGQSNGQGNGAYQDQQGYQPPAVDPAMFQQWISPLSQEVNSLKSFVQQIQQAESARYTSAFNAAEARFKSEPESRYFDNVRQQMAQLFQGGFLVETGDHYADLKSAYEMACNMNPEIRELRINERLAKSEADRRQAEKDAAEKARQASRSITGSPSTGPVRDDGDTGGDSVEDDVRRAVRAHAA